MKTTRETKWKLAAAMLVLGLAMLTVHVGRARSDVRYCEALAQRAAAQLQQQVQGSGACLAARTIPVPCMLPSGLI
jgi:F0F1-type ATP synthase membrane subunit c/vacuolar-type H+-ATPase subunit K